MDRFLIQKHNCLIFILLGYMLNKVMVEVSGIMSTLTFDIFIYFLIGVVVFSLAMLTYTTVKKKK